jgi:NTP pyrophosphatase (non-canonical NTP hydrolase)
VQIFCRASPEVCLKRVVERFERGERHPIHAERERLAEAETGVSPADLGQSGGWSRYTPLDLGVPTLVVDTTDGYAPPYEQIVAFATNGRMLPDGLGPIDPTGFQATVAQFVAAHDLDAPLTARVLDLVSEVGEVAKEVLKDSQYGREDFRRTPEWSSELADCFFSLICLANSTGVDLQLGLARALDKYRRRLDRRGDAGSGR